jgi:hypothetical protein
VRVFTGCRECGRVRGIAIATVPIAAVDLAAMRAAWGDPDNFPAKEEPFSPEVSHAAPRSWATPSIVWPGARAGPMASARNSNG